MATKRFLFRLHGVDSVSRNRHNSVGPDCRLCLRRELWTVELPGVRERFSVHHQRNHRGADTRGRLSLRRGHHFVRRGHHGGARVARHIAEFYCTEPQCRQGCLWKGGKNARTTETLLASA